MKILITGGAGFVGSALARYFASQDKPIEVIVLDNLKRRGSEINVADFKMHYPKVNFVYGDIRSINDIEQCGAFDVLIECSAEPSVLAGVNSSVDYAIQTNLYGSINCFNQAAKYSAFVVFLSTNRVYSYEALNGLFFTNDGNRFKETNGQKINENFSTNGSKSLYGATKLASEMILHEMSLIYPNLDYVINRCGVIAGEGQFGKVDQGIVMHWLLSHYFKTPLKYIGFGGNGYQVRDILDVNDLCELIAIQIDDTEICRGGKIYNVGGSDNSISLKELTGLCQEITGNYVEIEADLQTRIFDIKWYKSNIDKVKRELKWSPSIPIKQTLKNMHDWIIENEEQIKQCLIGV